MWHNTVMRARWTHCDCPPRDLSAQHFYAVSDDGPVAVSLAVSHAFLVAAAAAAIAAVGRVNLIKETSRIFGYANIPIFISLLPSLPLRVEQKVRFLRVSYRSNGKRSEEEKEGRG